MLNADDLKKMSSYEVENLADVDFYAVRNEGFRRHEDACKKAERLRKQLAKLEAEMAAAERIVKAATREQAKAA
jgi:hypothetical protein